MNILMLSSVFPLSDDKNKNATKVVNFFVNEWAKQGHKIIVIHNVHRYPSLVHLIPSKIKLKLATRLNFDIPALGDVKKDREEINGVKVYRLPIKKFVPHGGHPAFILKSQVKKIRDILDTKEHFDPDIIMGHWMSPQIQLISELKKIYNCRTSLVLHGRSYINDPKFDVGRYLPGIDALGCRSRSEAEFVKNVLGLEKSPFICYSGVPDQFVEQYHFDEEKFSTVPDEWKFIYVGRLVRYKNIDKVLTALAQFNDLKYQFDVVGTGAEEENLTALAESLHIADRVHFHGRVPREEVMKLMSASHGFIMVSKGEVFGLVYLEAMTASCLAIGSEGEGIDGVINDGENGFLCKPADAEALTQTLKHMFSLTSEELNRISRNGFKTAEKFTDSKVAKLYLEDAYKGYCER